jgi:hypothetical protein
MAANRMPHVTNIFKFFFFIFCTFAPFLLPLAIRTKRKPLFVFRERL